MTAKERTARLNAAFDVLADDLSQNEVPEMTIATTGVRTIDEVRQQLKIIRALARRNSAREIYAFEMCAGNLGRDGDLIAAGLPAYLRAMALVHAAKPTRSFRSQLREYPGLPATQRYRLRHPPVMEDAYAAHARLAGRI